MGTRRNFLRDVVLGIAATLVPKILQPVSYELQGEKLQIVRYTRYSHPENKIIFNEIRWVRKEYADECLEQLREMSEKEEYLKYIV